MINGYILMPTGAVVTVAAPDMPIAHIESPGPPQIEMSRPVPSGMAVVPVAGPQGRAGIDGASGAGGGVNRIAATNLSGHRVVVPNDNGEVIYADPTNPSHISRPKWFTTGAWTVGATASLTADGLVSEGTWSWIAGIPIYLGSNGLLTQTPPSSGFLQVVAEVVSSTTIDFNPHPPIVL